MQQITITKHLFQQSGNRPAKVAASLNGATYEMLYWTGRSITQPLQVGVTYTVTLEMSRDGQNYVIKSAQPVSGAAQSNAGAIPAPMPTPSAPAPQSAPQTAPAPQSGGNAGPQPLPNVSGPTAGMLFKMAAEVLQLPPDQRQAFGIDPFAGDQSDSDLVVIAKSLLAQFQAFERHCNS